MNRWIIHATFLGLYAAAEESSAKGHPVFVELRGRVVDLSPAAARLGVKRNMVITGALRIAPDARVAAFDPDRHRRWVLEMWQVLRTWTPWLEVNGDQEWYAAFSSEDPGREWKALFSRLADRLPPTGWTGFSGLAKQKLTAKAASLQITRGEADHLRPGPRLTVPPVCGVIVEDEAAFLSRLPLRHLWKIPSEVREELERLGIREAGQLREISTEVLWRRFGHEALIWQRWAAGEDGEPLNPGDPEPVITETWAASGDGAIPAEGAEPLLHRLCKRLSRRLERKNIGAQSLTLTWVDEEGKRGTEERLFTAAVHDPERLWRPTRELGRKLQRKRPDIKRISRVDLTAGRLRPLCAEQVRWAWEPNRFRLPSVVPREQWKTLLEELERKYPHAPVRYGIPTSRQEEQTAWWDPWRRGPEVTNGVSPEGPRIFS